MTPHQRLEQGMSHHRAGRLRDAETIYRQLLAERPDNADALQLLGSLAADLGRMDEAVDLIGKAIAINPNVAQYHANLGAIHARNQHFAAAMPALQRAIELDPNMAPAHYNLGGVLFAALDFDHAAHAFQRAIAISPNWPDAHQNLGLVLQKQAKYEEAAAAFRQAIVLRPDFARAHWNYACALLTLGQWKEGWEEFEWRLKVESLALNRHLPQPKWDGCDPTGKTILAHAEGGFGDALNFVRFVPLIAQRGARVILECQPELAPLLQGTAGADRVIARGQSLPAFDWQVPLQSLPRLLGITPQNIPDQVPYVAAPADRAKQWSDRLAAETSLRVGLAWCGSKRLEMDDRTQTIDVFAPLAQAPGVKFFGLQKGRGADQTPPKAMDWANYTPELNDFADMAALVQNLDLVVTVDTSIAHLAGAMGKPVWVLITFKSEFRWLLNRSDTPWYPTMRLFRQPTRTDWDTPMREMATALQQFTSRGRA